ncbi:hypothetical protein [Hymenobacter terricola]|uniref:hypothetical protein n=1 Tax=Hymenobacter terricola TaxID=2819236 RepID=UPI001B30749E|nr:hypothetical protein [Hymenobacter terricola]
MKPALLLLLALLLRIPAGPAPVRVTFSPLTKAAYLAAKNTCVLTRPVMTFPLKKQHGRITIPTAKGNRVFRDNNIDEENPDWEKFAYRGYLPQFECHLIEHNHYEWSNFILLDKSGQKTELYDLPRYSPDFKSFVAISGGIEYWAYPNSIRLFRFENDKWREVWKLEPSIEPMTWEPNDVYWLSTNVLILKKRMWNGNHEGNSYTYAKLTIQE